MGGGPWLILPRPSHGLRPLSLRNICRGRPIPANRAGEPGAREYANKMWVSKLIGAERNPDCELLEPFVPLHRSPSAIRTQ